MNPEEMMEKRLPPPHQGTEKSRKQQVMLVGQHSLAREGLRRLIEQDPLMEVVKEAGMLDEVHQVIHDVQPDLVLIDMSLPTNWGIEATRLMKTYHPATRIAVLLLRGDEPYRTVLEAAGVSVIISEGPGSHLLHFWR